MSDDDAPAEPAADDVEESAPDAAGETDPAETLEALRYRVDQLESAVDEAETEDDLDDAEDDLEGIRETIEEADLPEPYPPEDADDEEELDEDDLIDPADELEDELDELQSSIDDQRGPYASEAVDDVESAASDVADTRWAEEGVPELRAVVEESVDAVEGVLGTTISAAGDGDSEELATALETVADAIEDAELDPDEDDAAIADLLEIADDLQSGVDEATAWTDLPVREQLRREGFYDVLDHVKDFPPEWHALKVHEKRGNVDMILLAYESLGSDFMEQHCLEALERMGPEEAIEPMLQQAGRRDQQAISILGKIGVADDEVVETLLDYVDANDELLRTTTLQTLGELGADDAVQPIANQLVAENPTVRSAAARALGLIGDTRTIDPLADVLAEDDDDTARASAAWALNQIGTEAALDAVAPYADDRAYLVQAEAEKVA